MTALRSAMAAKGYKDSDSCLKEIGRRAVDGANGNVLLAVNLFKDELREHPDLVWYLLEPRLSDIARQYFPKRKAAPQTVNEIRRSVGLSPVQMGRDDTAGLRAVAHKTLLDTFIVNGQPIGDLTVNEARGWAVSRKRDARFVELLTANLPMNGKIRDFRSGEEAASLYQKAQESADA